MLEKIILFAMLLVVLVYPLQNISSNTDSPQELDSSEILNDEPFSEAQSAPPEISSQNTPATSSSIDETIDPYSFIPSNTNNVTIYNISETSFLISYHYEGPLEDFKLFFRPLIFIETETTVPPEDVADVASIFVDYWQVTGSYQGKSILVISGSTADGDTVANITLY